MDIENYKPLIYLISDELNSIESEEEILKSSTNQLGQLAEKLSLSGLGAGFSVALVGVLVSSPVIGLAIGLAGAGTTAVALTTAIIELFSSKNDIKSKNNQSQEILDVQQEIVTFLRDTKLDQWKSLTDIVNIDSLPENFKFPPGHPMPGQLYRQHPLKSKPNHYIPYQSYYALLFEEREAELIRILADLGATYIAIEEEQTSERTLDIDNKLAIDKLGSFEAGLAQERQHNNKNVRTLEYIGKPWKEGMEFDRSKYSWLDYEPSWNAIVEGRLHNGQLSAMIELKTDISNEISASLGIAEGLVKQVGSLELATGFTQGQMKKRKLMVKFANKQPAVDNQVSKKNDNFWSRILRDK